MKKIVLGMLIFCGFINFAEAATIENCTSESSTTPKKCWSCKSGYSPSSDWYSCVKCAPENCNTCSNNGETCYTCASGYKVSNGGCVIDEPIAHCTYQSNGKCYTCASPYLASTSYDSCVTVPHCIQTSGAYCSKCEGDYVLSQDQKGCTTCNASNCASCAGDGNSCYSCFSGYFKDSSGNCSACSEGCSSCNSSTSCSYCKTGYVLGNDGKCKKCPANCNYCSSDTQCTDCADGYGKDGNGGCKACAVNNCSIYACRNDYRKCDVCKTGYAMLPNGSCAAVEEDEICLKYRQDGSCYRCAEGYYNNNGECVSSCPEGKTVVNEQYHGSLCISDKCDSSGGYSGYSSSIGAVDGFTCYSCESGYTHLGDECVASCPAGYTRKSGSTYGYYCEPSNCASVTFVKCAKCSDGYYLTPDNNCVVNCGEGYLAGEMSGKCIPEEMGCGFSQKLVDGRCVEREEGDDCGDGYLGDDDLCKSNVTCRNGFEIVNGRCVAKLRYTMEEADAATSDDNENMIEWVFE